MLFHDSPYIYRIDVMNILGVSRSTAYKIMKNLNEELREKGYIVLAGKVPRQFFEEHFYGYS